MAIVCLEVVMRRVVGRVEVKDLDVLDMLASKEVATVGEHYLAALLDVQVLVLLDGVSEDIHHADLVVEAHHDLEARWVERHAAGLILERLINLKLEVMRGTVAPNFYGFVT